MPGRRRSRIQRFNNVIVLLEPNDIRCKYHGRRFQLDGQFLSMPEFKEVHDFPTEADSLLNLPLFTWGKWLFSSLAPTTHPEAFFADMAARKAALTRFYG